MESRAAPAPALIASPLGRALRASARTLWHLRTYECAQAAVPTVMGLIVAGASPSSSFWVLLAVGSHLLFIYNFNDLCDRAADTKNPRKLAKTAPGMQRLKRRICALTALLFAVCLTRVPLPIAGLLVALQLAGAAYSMPKLRFKAHPPASLAYHHFSGAGYLLAGAGVARAGFSLSLAAVAAFFALSYAAGNLNSELIDLRFDREAGMRTMASRLGAPRALRTVFALQLGAIVSLSLWLGGTAGAVLMIAFAAALALAYHRILGSSESELGQEAFLALRSRYRLLFSLAALSPLVKLALGAIG